MNKIKNVAIRLVHAIFIFVPLVPLIFRGMHGGTWNAHLLDKNVRDRQKFLYLPLWGCLVGFLTVVFTSFSCLLMPENHLATSYIILTGGIWMVFLIGLAYWVAPITWGVYKYQAKIHVFVTKKAPKDVKDVNSFMLGCLRLDKSTMDLVEDEFRRDCFECAIYHLTQYGLLTSPRSEIFKKTEAVD